MSTDTKKKPQMRLDANLDRTRAVPLHPETGKYWVERDNELMDISEDYRFSAWDEGDLRNELMAKYEKLKEGLEFGQEPVIMQCSFLVGAAWDMRENDLPKSFSCHPETWAAMKPEFRDVFELVEPKTP